MTFLCETRHTARKHRRCDYCRSYIAPGQFYVKIAGKWQGDFYAASGHIDCKALWDEAFPIHADDWEGMPFDLCEALDGDEDREIKQATFDHYRGRYPHVIVRLELRWQLGDIAEAERYRARGLEPDVTPIYG